MNEIENNFNADAQTAVNPADAAPDANISVDARTLLGFKADDRFDKVDVESAYRQKFLKLGARKSPNPGSPLMSENEYQAELANLKQARAELLEEAVTGELKLPEQVKTQEFTTSEQWNKIKEDGYMKAVIAHCVRNNYDLAQNMTEQDFNQFKAIYPTQEDFMKFGDIVGLTKKMLEEHPDQAAEIPKAATRLTRLLPK